MLGVLGTEALLWTDNGKAATASRDNARRGRPHGAVLSHWPLVCCVSDFGCGFLHIQKMERIPDTSTGVGFTGAPYVCTMGAAGSGGM